MMMKHDDFGDRMKAYEKNDSTKLMVGMPVCARIDGRGFSRFTKGFEKPFDRDIMQAMQATCAKLVADTHALIGYVQSDEITLIWEPQEGSQMMFEGKVQKLTSVMAGITTSAFTFEMLDRADPEVIRKRAPVFDCRVWNVPNRSEAANVVLWRTQDATRNAISSACRAVASSKEMHGLNQEEMKNLMQKRGVDYDEHYAQDEKYGALFKRVTREREFTTKERRKIEAAGWSAPLKLVRSHVEMLSTISFGSLLAQERVDTIFESV
jgi:tRNA(His) guanylyltransferase